MKDFLSITEQGGLTSVIGSGALVTLGKPFVQEIYLTSCPSAGARYVDNIEDILAQVEEGARVRLVREPENPYDELAIRIETMNGIKIGYVPRRKNSIPARLMDAGKMLFGRLEHHKEEFYLYQIKLYMED